MTELLAGFRDL